MLRRRPLTYPSRIRTLPPSLSTGRTHGSTTMHKYVYYFGDGKADGKSEMRNLLGGKGANLAEMTLIGLPVPSGFTLSTDVCTYFYAHGRQYPPELKSQVDEALRKVEKSMGAKFGDTTN